MTTVMNLTARNDIGAVLIEVTGAPAGGLTIYREDMNGPGTVRLLAGQVPISGALTVYDYEAALTGTVYYGIIGDRTNLMTNPSFETDLTGWTASAGTMTRDATEHNSGAYSMKVTGAAGWRDVYSANVAAGAGRKYALSTAVKGSGSATLSLYNQANTLIASTVVSLSGAWQRVGLSGISPVGTTAVYVTAGVQVVTAGVDQLFADAFLLEADTLFSKPYIEGTVTNTSLNESVVVDGYYPVISAAALPQYRAMVTAVTDYDASQEYGGTVHWVVDRPDPLVITSPMRYREGSFVVRCTTFDEAEVVVDVASTGNVMMLRQNDHPGMDMYFVSRRARKSPITDGTRDWEVSFDYTQVKVPSGDLKGAAVWNFDAVEAIGTFTDVKNQFATMKALVIGP